MSHWVDDHVSKSNSSSFPISFSVSLVESYWCYWVFICKFEFNAKKKICFVDSSNWTGTERRRARDLLEISQRFIIHPVFIWILTTVYYCINLKEAIKTGSRYYYNYNTDYDFYHFVETKAKWKKKYNAPYISIHFTLHVLMSQCPNVSILCKYKLLPRHLIIYYIKSGQT